MTIEAIQSINYMLALAGVAGMIVTVLLIIDMSGKRLLSGLVARWGLTVAFLATLGTTLMALTYSEVFGFIPCGLCWLIRIALFPQVLLTGTAIYFKDSLMPRYGIVLSAVGLVISLYHHYIQMGGSEFVKCPAAGVGADCAKRFFFEFGFITFPFMSAILFAFLIALYMYILKVRSH